MSNDRDDSLLYDEDGQVLPVERWANRHEGRSAFLIGGGPSLTVEDAVRIDRSGIITMTINGHGPAGAFMPDYWIATDPPKHFIGQPMLADLSCTKLLPTRYAKDGKKTGWINVVYYRLAMRDGDPKKFLKTRYVDWGDYPTPENKCGVRSTMLAALRFLHWFGVKTVYLAGVDFPHTGNSNDPDHFTKLAAKLEAIAPVLKDAGMNVLNCNPHSELRVFEFTTIKQAIERGVAADSEVLDGISV